MSPIIAYFVVQIMAFSIAVVGGVQFGTGTAGWLCFFSQVVGVIFAAFIWEHNLTEERKK